MKVVGSRFGAIKSSKSLSLSSVLFSSSSSLKAATFSTCKLSSSLSFSMLSLTLFIVNMDCIMLSSIMFWFSFSWFSFIFLNCFMIFSFFFVNRATERSIAALLLIVGIFVGFSSGVIFNTEFSVFIIGMNFEFVDFNEKILLF